MKYAFIKGEYMDESSLSTLFPVNEEQISFLKRIAKLCLELKANNKCVFIYSAEFLKNALQSHLSIEDFRRLEGFLPPSMPDNSNIYTIEEIKILTLNEDLF